jgi:hypothetical protein
MLNLLKVDTRIADGSTAVLFEDWAHGSNATSVLVEDNIALILDELALPEDTDDFTPSTRSRLSLQTSRGKASAEGISGFPSIIVRDLAANVVQDVSLGDSVRRRSANHAPDLATTNPPGSTTEQGTINGSEGTTGEGELGSTVMGNEGVGVLEESDEDEPRVNPEVGNAIDAHHLTESTVIGPGAEDTEPKSDTNVGNDNLPGMVRCVERGLGDKVVSEPRVPPLSRRVPDQVQGPSEEQLHSTPKGGTDRRVSDSFQKFLLNLCRDVEAEQVVATGCVKGRKANLLAGFGDKDLILGHVSSRSVMLCVRDAPGVVRDTETRVKKPSDGVVDRFALTESLVSTFVCNDPKAGCNQTSCESVCTPQRELGNRIESRMGIVDSLEQGLDKLGRLIDAGEESNVHQDI